MNVKRGFVIALAAVVLLALIPLAPLAWTFTAGMRAPVQVPEPDYWPTLGWRTSTPENQGFDSAKLAQGLLTLQKKEVNIDSLMIIRNGYLVMDAHFDPYDGTFKHDLASVTKSVTTSLIAIAVEQGKLDLDQPMVSFFPGRTIANLDARKARITVRHLAGMVNGMQSGCAKGDETNMDAMRSTPDWIQAALDRPMVAEPGTRFCYDSPGMHLLSAILQQATGMSELDFARQYLFGPLGIQDVLWEIDPQGYSRGWGDLHLLPEDAAKIGYLWLHRGQWDGQQIIPEAWVLDSVKAHSKFVGDDYGYGYGWWVSPGDYHAAGRGGQRVRVIASANTLVVTTGANYDYAEVNSWLVPILLRVKEGRPANPQGTAALEAALAAVQKSAPEWSAAYTPDIAGQVSGVTYRCESNPAGIQTVRIVFDSPQAAALYLRMNGQDELMPIGMQGSYRLAADGAGYRGHWEDARTFHLEAFDIGRLERRVVFEGQGIQISLPELDLQFACQAQDT